MGVGGGCVAVGIKTDQKGSARDWTRMGGGEGGVGASSRTMIEKSRSAAGLAGGGEGEKTNPIKKTHPESPPACFCFLSSRCVCV